ncbi:MAG TPA: pyridoxamine 5'-phosphate oxidase family protein [Steroidobacteraceae bacterium]|nr:pyridoxamine 5'-phosphate oxidase family protein [Steroidobacteraceae bacterium]
MSELYSDAHRAFQDERETRRLADRLESLAHAEFDPQDRGFIESAAMFFLATVDHRGRPTVSYKGGAPGFVRIVAPGMLVFPVYDGNGMFLSLGNISSTANVGMLFIDFASPRRLRVQGTARVFPNGGPHGGSPGAQYLIEVTAEQVFVNCGRYIHKLESKSLSPHVPDENGRQPFPAWKRIDLIADSLPERDRTRVMSAGGPIGIDAYRGEDPADGSSDSA